MNITNLSRDSSSAPRTAQSCRLAFELLQGRNDDPNQLLVFPETFVNSSFYMKHHALELLVCT